MYFGHDPSTYDTDLERALLAAIAATFPSYTVENPNQPHHLEGYHRWRQMTGDGREYYRRIILPRMDAGVFLASASGLLSADTYADATWFDRHRKPTYLITRTGEIVHVRPDARLAMPSPVGNPKRTR